MEKQTHILSEKEIDTKDKGIRLAELFTKFKQHNNISRLITKYGSIDSKIVFLAESPMAMHYASSGSIFCLDLEDYNQAGKSGEVILKIFKDLKLDINDYYFDNVFKVPIESVAAGEYSTHLDLLVQELNVIEPKVIVCLGNTAFELVSKLNLDYAVIKLYHPAYILRSGWTKYNSYLNSWKEVFDEWK